ncbi:hypothetical protein HD806DRAFT_543434 [Xylariaceae sp. AK1471]|nr:hypothetical protein HD806DRAFT_543434 [Xylariaceae sp. AK1471]
MPEKRPLGQDQSGSDRGEAQNDSKERTTRVLRSLGMSEDERAARERRRAYFRAQARLEGEGHRKTKEPSNSALELVAGQTEFKTEAAVSEPRQLPPGSAANRHERKPWESLVIGSLGENLSHIERKDREIEQQRYIVRFYEEHSPDQVEHNSRILDRLIQERGEMEDNEENNMPEDRREEKERLCRRLEVLRWALDTSQCNDERINIKAAIEGYETGQIPYSHNFTLIYAGCVVDICPTYHSFCEDRSARLDHYFAEHGPGWLWQEPPLASPGSGAVGKKGLCLDRNFDRDKYHIGHYQVNMEFAIRRDKVSRGKSLAYPLQKGGSTTMKMQNGDASCQLETLLDSGATFPMIFESDLPRLNINLTKYPAQGVEDVQIVGGIEKFRFYEMHVSVCSKEGNSIVGLGDEAVWPAEPRTLGGIYPVMAMEGLGKGANVDQHRISGLVPFDVCYMSSAPSMARIWIGEDRRDVLGTSRLPAHLRFDTNKKFVFDYPQEFEKLRKAARTPDRVIFFHEFPDNPDILLTDSDTLSTRGKSELAIGQYQTENGSSGEKISRKALPKRVIQIEPRKGGIKFVLNKKARPWKKYFNMSLEN